VDLDPLAGAAGLPPVRARIRDWLREAGLVGPELDEVVIAVGEACSNVIEHSGADSADGSPAGWVECSRDAAEVRILVCDRGRWRPPDPDTGARRRRGRGRSIMAALMDRMSIRTDSGGTVVELVKERTLSNSPHEGSPDGAPRLTIQQPRPGELVLAGEVDMTQAEELRSTLDAAAADGTALLVDLRAVNYLDSAGVSVLVEQTRRPIRLLVRAGSAVATVVTICGLPGMAEVEFVAGDPVQ
jgi:anti-anti-sigma factor